MIIRSSLYGLKQAERQYFYEISTFSKENWINSI